MLKAANEIVKVSLHACEYTLTKLLNPREHYNSPPLDDKSCTYRRLDEAGVVQHFDINKTRPHRWAVALGVEFKSMYDESFENLYSKSAGFLCYGDVTPRKEFVSPHPVCIRVGCYQRKTLCMCKCTVPCQLKWRLLGLPPHKHPKEIDSDNVEEQKQLMHQKREELENQQTIYVEQQRKRMEGIKETLVDVLADVNDMSKPESVRTALMELANIARERIREWELGLD
jgi:hypothetical protein